VICKKAEWQGFGLHPCCPPACRSALTLQQDLCAGAGYMQMTQEQVEEWSSNPDQYVADEEEETFSVRVSGELVLDELMAAFPEAAVAAVAAAVNARLQEAAQAKVQQLTVHHNSANVLLPCSVRCVSAGLLGCSCMDRCFRNCC